MAEERRPRNLWVKDAYLDQLLSGHKAVEVRVGYRNILRLLPGDRLLLNGRHRAAIKRIGRYINFLELLDREDPAAIALNLTPGELLAALREIYPAEKESRGAVALELEVMPDEAIE